MSIEEINAICDAAAQEPLPEPDPHREGIDWIRAEDGDIKHPLQHRSFESSVRFTKQARALGLESLQDKDLDQFRRGFSTFIGQDLAFIDRHCGQQRFVRSGM